MNTKELKDNLNINLDSQQLENFEKFITLFKEYNAHTNLMSKNDLALIFEKHIFDSLAFNLFYEKYKLDNKIKLMDIGTGGGFPAIPISLYYNNIDVTAVDSINKKINFIKSVQEEFFLNNLNPVCKRIEQLDSSLKNSFEIVTTRALSSLDNVINYALPYLKKGGYFVAYKSKNVDAEIAEAQKSLKKFGTKIIDKIQYNLPLEGDFERYLVVVRK